MDSGLWTDSFLEYLKSERNYSAHTIESYSCSLREFQDFFDSLNEGLSWKTIDASIVREWIVFMLDEQGMSEGSANTHLCALRSFYKYLRMMSLIDSNPLIKVTGPKKKKPLPSFVRESEIDKLLEIMYKDRTFSGVRDRLIIMMFYTTGIRRAEMQGLKDEDIDLGTKQIKVLGKRNKQRIIPFGEELEKEIAEYYNLRKDVIGDRKTGSFLINETGTAITNDYLGKVVKDNLSLVTFQKKRSPHVLRHSFATAMLNNNADLGSIQKLLGHQSLATTEVYTHLSFEELKDVYKNAHPRK